MKIVFLASARRDLEWFRQYYERVFPQGGHHAAKQYMQTIKNLQENPAIGHRVEGENLRALTVVRTPFILTYRINDDAIEIVRVRDGRSAE